MLKIQTVVSYPPCVSSIGGDCVEPTGVETDEAVQPQSIFRAGSRGLAPSLSVPRYVLSKCTSTSLGARKLRQLLNRSQTQAPGRSVAGSCSYASSWHANTKRERASAREWGDITSSFDEDEEEDIHQSNFPVTEEVRPVYTPKNSANGREEGVPAKGDLHRRTVDQNIAISRDIDPFCHSNRSVRSSPSHDPRPQAGG